VNEKRQIEMLERRYLETLRVFHEVSTALTSNLDLDSLLSAFMAQMEDHFGFKQWSLLMLDGETQELYYALHKGIDEAAVRGIRIPMGEGLAGGVAKTGDPLFVRVADLDLPGMDSDAKGAGLRVQSITSLPIRYGHRTFGVLQIYDSTFEQLPDASVSFLPALCEYAAIALENARQVDLIHHLSITDDCTGLFNARHLYTLLEQEIAVCAPAARVVPIRQPHFSLIFLDLDRFKAVNDTHGHLVGSRLLAEVGGVIRRVLGPHHAGFRYGGDEFVALLRGLDKPEALELAHRLRAELTSNTFLTANNLSVSLTASFGLATYPQDGDTLHGIIRSADTAMYAAKAGGRDRIEVAGEGPRSEPSPHSRHS